MRMFTGFPKHKQLINYTDIRPIKINIKDEKFKYI